MEIIGRKKQSRRSRRRMRTGRMKEEKGTERLGYGRERKKGKIA